MLLSFVSPIALQRWEITSFRVHYKIWIKIGVDVVQRSIKAQRTFKITPVKTSRSLKRCLFQWKNRLLTVLISSTACCHWFHPEINNTLFLFTGIWNVEYNTIFQMILQISVHNPLRRLYSVRPSDVPEQRKSSKFQLQVSSSYLCDELTSFFNKLGLRISLSNKQTISSNLGRLVRSLCQQSIIRWYRASGQSIGPGNL